MNKHKILVLVLLIFILMGAVSASENVTDTSTNNDAVTGDVLASPDNSQTSSVADSNNNNNNVGNVTNVTKNNNSNLLSSPNTGGNVLNAPDDSFTALQTLINGAASGSTLTLDKNYKFYADSDSAYLNGIVISNPITINGNGYIIDASNAARIFSLKSTVNIYNLTFANALVNANGGSVICDVDAIKNPYFETQSGTIKDWTYNKNVEKDYSYLKIYTGSYSGNGQIYQDLNFDNINSISIKYDVLPYTNFYVYVGSTRIYSTGEAQRTVTLDVSKFKGNQRLLLTVGYTMPPEGQIAGWVARVYYVISNSVNINFNDCTFVNSTATNGGAIYAGSGARLNINNCIFDKCSANGYGGALYGNAKMTVTKSIFTNNTATNYGAVAATTTTGNTFTNNIIVKNTGSGTTSSVFYSSNSATSYTLNNNWFGHNSTNKDNFASIIPKPAKSTLNTWYYLDTETNNTYNVLWRNEANTQVRYAFKSTGSTGIITALPSITVNNIQAYNGNVDVDSVSVINGVSDWFTFDAGNTYGDAGFIGDYNGAKAGHVFQVVPEDSFSVLNRIIDESTTDSLDLTHGYHYYPEYDSNFINGIPISKSLTINAVNCTINGLNTARVFSIAGSVNITGLTFKNGKAGNGGAISSSNGILNVVSCNFVNNVATAAGGAVFNQNDNIYFDHCNFTNNAAGSDGGVLRGFNSAIGTFNDCIFTNNTAAAKGGAIYTGALKVTISNSSFIDTTGLRTIYSENSLTVVNSKFILTTKVNGGAIYAESGLTVSNSSFINYSHDGNGGVIHVKGKTTVTGSSFINNTGAVGGVFFFETGSGGSVVDGCLFLNNYATGGFGGGVAFSRNLAVTVKNSIILNNTAAYSDNRYKIFTTDFATSGTFYTLNYNWWGHNSSNKGSLTPVIPAQPAHSTLNNWLYLCADTNVTGYDYLFRNETVLMNYNFKSTGGTPDFSKLPSITLDLTSVNGDLNVTNVTLNAGVSENFTFKAMNDYGIASVKGDYIGLAYDTHKFSIVLEDSFSALAKLIDEAPAGSSLNLTHGYHYYSEYDSNWKNGIAIGTSTVYKDLTINAVNCIIDGRNVARIFNIRGSVVLNNLTMVNATATDTNGWWCY